MAVWSVIKDKLWLVLVTLLFLWNRIRVKMGLLRVKYGILGYFEYKGLHLPNIAISKERLDAIDDYDNFRPDDVVMMTYPKTGTHFVGEVLLSIYKEKEMVDQHATLGTVGVPLEFSPAPLFHATRQGEANHPLANLDVYPCPRTIATHLPWNFLPAKVKESQVKVIHCYRNPKDVVCSFRPYLAKMGLLTSETSLKKFVEFFIDGTVMYCGYFKWLRQWYPHRNSSKMLNLKYEDMKQNLKGNVEKMAEFLNLELTPEQVNRIVAANTFEAKKKVAGNRSFLYRKGKSGGWMSDITVEQNEMLDEWIKEETADMEDLKFDYI